MLQPLGHGEDLQAFLTLALCWSAEVHPPAAEVNTSSTARVVVSLLLSENDSQNRNGTILPPQQNIVSVKVHFARVHNAGIGC
jgi:hypothetical protein